MVFHSIKWWKCCCCCCLGGELLCLLQPSFACSLRENQPHVKIQTVLLHIIEPQGLDIFKNWTRSERWWNFFLPFSWNQCLVTRYKILHCLLHKLTGGNWQFRFCSGQLVHPPPQEAPEGHRGLWSAVSNYRYFFRLRWLMSSLPLRESAWLGWPFWWIQANQMTQRNFWVPC